jgi:hypothetical protein
MASASSRNPVQLQHQLPIPALPGPLPLPPGQLLKSQHRRIAVDAGHLVGIRNGPVVGVEPATAEA